MAGQSPILFLLRAQGKGISVNDDLTCAEGPFLPHVTEPQALFAAGSNGKRFLSKRVHPSRSCIGRLLACESPA